MPSWLDSSKRTPVVTLQALLTFSAVAVLVVGTLMIVNMSESEASHGGRVYVGVAMIVLLAVIAGKLAATRRRSGSSATRFTPSASTSR
jgi:NADH:ubiquinone oxidoreductase subunit 6 (subunit J)